MIVGGNFEGNFVANIWRRFFFLLFDWCARRIRFQSANLEVCKPKKGCLKWIDTHKKTSKRYLAKYYINLLFVGRQRRKSWANSFVCLFWWVFEITTSWCDLIWLCINRGLVADKIQRALIVKRYSFKAIKFIAVQFEFLKIFNHFKCIEKKLKQHCRSGESKKVFHCKTNFIVWYFMGKKFSFMLPLKRPHIARLRLKINLINQQRCSDMKEVTFSQHGPFHCYTYRPTHAVSCFAENS